MEKEYGIKMKNGDVINVSYEVYSKLCDGMNKGISQFASFTDNNQKYFLTINLNEVMYIK